MRIDEHPVLIQLRQHNDELVKSAVAEFRTQHLAFKGPYVSLQHLSNVTGLGSATVLAVARRIGLRVVAIGSTPELARRSTRFYV